MKALRTLFTGKPPQKARLAILVSGRGSNMRALLDAMRLQKLDAECILVLSDREATGLGLAQKYGVPTELFPKKKGESREGFDARLAERLKKENPTLVICAGYLKLITAPLLNAFPNRILNIHPALLPAFPGLNAQKQALDYGVKITGCTVHLVDRGMDTGKILAQSAVPVQSKDTVETLSRRILKAEHQLYWRAIQQYLKKLPA
ncbi:MAG: Phosphoribosylglycinamide formyltransferase [Turneriella sp.]|nr:Phosphoribosylglycinamide formyltransferase [Turneriella sp.]